MLKSRVLFIKLKIGPERAGLLGLLLCMVLFAGCGLNMCVNAADIDKDHYRFMMPTSGPDTLKVDDASTYWAKTTIYLSPGNGPGQAVKVSATSVTLCNGLESIISVPPGTSTHSLGFQVLSGDEVKVTLQPKQGTLKKEACDNLDPNIFIEKPEECKQHVNDTYYSKVGNTVDPSSNRFYPNGQLQTWYNGKLYAMLDESKLAVKSINDVCLTTGSNLLPNLISPVPTVACIKYYLSDPCATAISNYAISASDIAKSDTYDINSRCGNICGVAQQCGSATCPVVKNNHCAYTEVVKNTSTGGAASTTIQGLKGNYISYLPYLRIKMKNALTSWDLPEYNDSALGVTGVKTGEPTLSSGAIPFDSVETTLSQGSGGYTISITKDCSKATANSLYYIVKKGGVPRVLPGDSTTTKIDFTTSTEFIVPATAEGDLYVGIYDPDRNYDNNDGYFTLDAFISKDSPKVISKIVGYVKKYVMIALYGPAYDNFFKTGSSGTGAVGSIYNALTQTPFMNIVRMMLVAYITIYSALFFVGAKRLSILEAVIMTCKVGVIIKLLGPDSWEFFNKHLFILFSQAPTALIDMIANKDLATSGTFDFLDKPFYRFTFTQTWVQILSLLFAGPFGWVCIIVIFWALWVMFSAIFELVITYFIALTMVGLLLSLAPFFLSMILFQRTKAIFDMWIAALSQNAMHPVVMFVSFAFMSEIVSGIAYSLFSYDVCSDCILEANITLGALKIPICLFDFILPSGFSPNYSVGDYNKLRDEPDSFMGIPISIVKLLMLVVCAHAMKHIISFAGNVVLSIFGVVASDLSSVGHAASQGLMGMVGMDKESRDRRDTMDYHNKKNASKSGPGEKANRKGADTGDSDDKGGKDDKGSKDKEKR